MKSYMILPIVAIFLVAISLGDELWSLPYLMKMIPALILLILSVILLTLDLRKKKQVK